MTTSYFIYYTVGDAATSREPAHAMQAELATQAGVTARLMHRCDDPATWMEIYEHVVDPPAFERALDAAVARHGMGKLLAPGARRHVERFAPF